MGGGLGLGLGLKGGQSLFGFDAHGLGFGGQFLPGRLVLGHPPGLLLRRLALAGFFIGQTLGLFGCGLLLRQLGPQPLQFLVQRRVGLGRVGRRNERAGLEARVIPEGAVEPDADLPGDLERGQGLPMIAAAVMSRRVADLADRVEQVGHLARDGAINRKAAQHIGEGLGRIVVASGSGGDVESDQFSELAQLQQASVWVLREIPLSQSRMTDQLVVMNGEKSEVGRNYLHGNPLVDPIVPGAGMVLNSGGVGCITATDIQSVAGAANPSRDCPRIVPEWNKALAGEG